MDLFSHAHAGMALTQKGHAESNSLSLYKHEIFAFSEAALEEKTVFMFLPRLADQFQQFVLLLPIKKRLQSPILPQVPQSNTPLTFLLKLHLNNCQLTLFGLTQVNMRIVMIDPQLKHINFPIDTHCQNIIPSWHHHSAIDSHWY